MVKRLSKVAALLAAGALFFGGTFLSCSSDGLPPELGGGSGSGAGGSGGAGGGGGESSGDSGDGAASTYQGPDSWDFVSKADSVAWVTSLKSNTASGGDETRTLSAEIAIRGAGDKATLTLLKDTAFDYTSKFSNGKNKSDPSFSYIDPELGIRIKSTGMKIAGVTGKVNLKIVWVGGSSRGIGIFKGTSDSSPTIKNVDTTKTETTATNGSTQKKTLAVYEQDDIDTVIDLSSATDLYIVADNNIYIKSVALTSASGAAADPDTPEQVTASIVYNAKDTTPAFALAADSEGDIFGTVAALDDTKAGMDKEGFGLSESDEAYTLADGYPKVEGTSFTSSSKTKPATGKILDSDPAATEKNNDATANGWTVKYTGYTLKSTLIDNNTKVNGVKDKDCAHVEYSFTLARAAKVVVDVVAFNSQSGNYKGKIVIKDSTDAEVSGATNTGNASKEDNDVSSKEVKLDAGTYTLRYSWIPKDNYADTSSQTSGKDSRLPKNFVGAIQSVTITATADKQ